LARRLSELSLTDKFFSQGNVMGQSVFRSTILAALAATLVAIAVDLGIMPVHFQFKPVDSKP
jgi:hypothetical protein